LFRDLEQVWLIESIIPKKQFYSSIAESVYEGFDAAIFYNGVYLGLAG